MRPVGIDFGTTNSLVAVHGTEGPDVLSIDEPPADWGQAFEKVLPSVFAIGAEERPLFGWEAKMQLTGKVEAIKRLFAEEEAVEVAGRRFLVEEVATLLFAHMKRAAAGAGYDFSKAVVTVPANSRGLARYRTKLCAGMAGIEVMALINEPTAAAMAHGARSMGDRTVMVVDWGGGTLDVTVLQTIDGVFFEQVSKGHPKLGGTDFDSRFAKAISETIPDFGRWGEEDRGKFKLDVERAKIRLSTQEETNLPLPGGEYTRLTRRMFEQATEALLLRAREPIERCLTDLPSLGGELDTVILAGGTCSIPAVRGLVDEMVDCEVASGIDPLTAIAEGAAIAAAILSGEREANDFFVSTEHALGTAILDAENAGLVFDAIIPRNHKLPAKATQTYFPVRDHQDKIDIRVMEGDPDLPLDHGLNVQLKEWEVEIPNPAPLGESSFDMTYEYDTDGILHVSIRDNSSGDFILEDDVSFDLSRDKSELVEVARRANATVQQNKVAEEERQIPTSHDPEVDLLLQRARTKVIPFLDDEEADRVRGMVKNLVEAGDAEVDEAKAALQTELQKYTYLF